MIVADHVAIISELGVILRGDHTKWGGDRRMNGYGFLARVRRDTPHIAQALAADLAANIDGFAAATGVSPDTLRAACKVLTAELTSL